MTIEQSGLLAKGVERESGLTIESDGRGSAGVWCKDVASSIQTPERVVQTKRHRHKRKSVTENPKRWFMKMWELNKSYSFGRFFDNVQDTVGKA